MREPVRGCQRVHLPTTPERGYASAAAVRYGGGMRYVLIAIVLAAAAAGCSNSGMYCVGESDVATCPGGELSLCAREPTCETGFGLYSAMCADGKLQPCDGERQCVTEAEYQTMVSERREQCD